MQAQPHNGTRYFGTIPSWHKNVVFPHSINNEGYAGGQFNLTILEVAPLATSRYKALSYVWGDDYDTVPIQCNGVEIQVTRNLYWALQHLSVTFTSHSLWIDAICINQHEEAQEEKGQQIDIMGEIYSQAEEVLIWLAESTLPVNADLCFEACKTYGRQWRYAKMLIALSYRGTWKQLSDKTVQTSLALNNPFTEEIMAGLLEIMRHRYWTRIWVIQEMTLASKSRIVTGRSSLNWIDFKIFLTMMEHCLPWWLRGMGPNFRALNDMTRMEQIGEPPVTYGLSDLLVQFRWSSAKETRDKVYGLLGLLSQSQRDLMTSASYFNAGLPAS
ncbi:heterokaryon incompatibility protein-domain-containing protein [Triangularia verruculosa]|uniref:Heterokaryon incompatibility protein-domain-containing protein n=1 Tax=Triangularia verruculosa TaxID=2587418 RepID=A0AAN6XEZ6_9PEZI|nr:heterokaryon incompatibility protein-domain-containing protein [Triangularia verruculosa]